MCLAVTAQVIAIEGDFAKVDMMGFISQAYIALVKDVRAGDYVLVHAGCAIEKIDEEAFDYYNELLSELAVM